MKKVIVFISGRGSNLLSLIKNAKYYQISHIISNKALAPGLQYGKEFNIAISTFDRKDFNSLKEQKKALYSFAGQLNPDYIALAGFMSIVPEDFVREWYGKIINIHPSLLPKYPGLDTHQRVLDAKERRHGCTVHFLDTGIDTGPVIAQSTCEVLPEDTEETLSAKVLKLEHKLYPWALNNISSENIKLYQHKVLLEPQTAKERAGLQS